MTPTAKKPVLKHREVASALRCEIESGLWKGAERLPGEQDLARRYAVAHLTMRQAVANLVEEGFLIRVRGKGTFVVSQDRKSGGRSTRHAMALLFPADAEWRDPYYFPEVLEGFQSRLTELGHCAAIHGDGVADSLGTLEPGSAVACLLFKPTQVQMIERLRDNGYRVLAINRYSGRRSIPCVRIDDAQGVESAVEHLVSRGHERIGFVAGPATNFDAADRLRGFRDAVKRHNLRVAPEAGDAFNEAGGYMAARDLLSASNRPTAIICASDLAALGVIKAAHEFGISVPRGLSVVGFGDFSVADYMLPGLTTVRQNRLGLGRAAADSLIELASGKEIDSTVLAADLIVRDSTAETVSSALHAR
jgi:DNA-binding LacI/PurR family transcriptional regulator